MPGRSSRRKGHDFEREMVHRFAEVNDIPIVYFKKGESKEEFVRPYLKTAAAKGDLAGRLEAVVLAAMAEQGYD